MQPSGSWHVAACYEGCRGKLLVKNALISSFQCRHLSATPLPSDQVLKEAVKVLVQA